MGSYQDIAGTDMVIMAGGAIAGDRADTPAGKSPSRQDLLPASFKIIEEWARAINSYCPQAIVINVSNPSEVLNYASYLLSSTRERNRFIGYSLNDTIRFQNNIAGVLGVAPSRVSALVIGEHGGSMVLLFSSIKLDGDSITLTEDVKAKVREISADYLPHMFRLKIPRSSGWLTGIGLTRIIKAIVDDTGEVIPCGAVLDGEYGYQGICLGVPATLGRRGICGITECELASEERELLDRSVTNIKPSIDFVLKQVEK